MSPTTRPMLPIATAVALALSVSACASPWAKSGQVASTSSSSVSASDSAAENADANSTSGNGQAARPDLPPASALSPTDQAEYCKRTGPLEVALPSEDGRRQAPADLKRQAEIWTELSSYSPLELRRDVALLATDYQALSDGSRTMPSVEDEVEVAFGRVNDYRNLICLTQEERDKAAGN